MAHIACHSERSEESALSQSIATGTRGFFAALRMTDEELLETWQRNRVALVPVSVFSSGIKNMVIGSPIEKLELLMSVGSQGDRKGRPYPTTQRSPARFVYGRDDRKGRSGSQTIIIFGGEI